MNTASFHSKVRRDLVGKTVCLFSSFPSFLWPEFASDLVFYRTLSYFQCSCNFICWGKIT